MDTWFVVLVVVAALGSGAISGAFYAFSSFVMAGLKRLPPSQGALAMQSINVTAVGPGFMLGFFGTAVLSLVVGIWAVVDWVETSSVYVIAGAGLYLLGVFALTAGYHVPRNNRLAAQDPETDAGRAYWAQYLRVWTRWNHVRGLAGLLAAAAYIVALLVAP